MMTIELWQLFITAVSYLGLLFLVAYAAERGWLPQGLVRHPLIYCLSLGVYATSWSFYGSVGLAEQSGYVFLTIYIGATLAFSLTPLLLLPLQRLVQEYQLASVADLFAFRYASQSSGLLVTLFMLVGILPYLALQVQAVVESARVIVRDAPPDILALVTCITLMLFAILFGARHLTPRDKHEGLVSAIAFESAIKLFALLAVGAYALFSILNGPKPLTEWVSQHPVLLRRLYQPVIDGPWTAFLVLSFCAAILLPRQFHMTFTENRSRRELRIAAWVFPLYLLLLNLPIIPILWAGQVLHNPTATDFFALGITLESGKPWLTLLVFIGGVSAASAMMIVETLALASMCMNHLLLPLRLLGSTEQDDDLYGWILWGKRFLIITILAAAYLFHRLIEHNQGLAQLGLVSFVAVAQLLPGLLGVLFWPRATRIGFMLGLSAGALVWFFLLVLPLLVRNDTAQVLALYNPFDHEGSNRWSIATFWSLTINSLLFVLGSLASLPRLAEAEAAERCRPYAEQPLAGVVTATSARQFERQLAKVMGTHAAQAEVLRACQELDLGLDEQRPSALLRLRERIYRNLSGLLGPALARLIVDDQLRLRQQSHIALAESLRFMEEQLEDSRTRLQGAVRALDDLRRYHRDVLHTLPLGVCAVTPWQEVLIWNEAMRRLSGIEPRVAVGHKLGNLPMPWGTLLAEFANVPYNHRDKQTLQLGQKWHSYRLHKARLVVHDDQPEEASGLVILLEDRTERDNLEAELVHSERLASIGRFAAGVAHEIGNPVTGIACIAQNLRDDPDPQLLEESVQDILLQTQRISDIVKTLLAFSHGEPLTRQPYSQFFITDAVSEAIRLVRLSRAARLVELSNQVPSSLQLYADRPRMLQVLVNLLTNACDASPPCSHVLVQAQVLEDLVELAIIDHGCGISEELRQHIFEPFFTTKPVGEGTGLGLSLVHSIIEDHQGSIQIRSQPEQGTTVILRLPLEHAAT